MKQILTTLIIFCVLFAGNLYAQEKEYSFEKDATKFTKEQLPPKYQVDTRIDNMGYWKKMAEAGLVPVAPNVTVPSAVRHTSKIMAPGFAAGNSPDVPVTTVNSTQTENSAFASPDDFNLVINSNNSTPNPSGGTVYGANEFNSPDGGITWGGTVQGAGGSNSGDPTTAIDNLGRWYIGFINNLSGQSVAYSDDQGGTWTVKTVANSPSGFGNMLDKNHMWIDNSQSSLYEGNLYDAWTTFGGGNDGEIGVSRSTDRGNTWSAVQHVSAAVNAGSHNQGVNIKTGPNGEVYVLWAIYDNWPQDENALAMAKSIDGGQTWQPAYRIINNIKGIRNHAVTQNMRVNSFPCMAVDLSNSPHRGDIYVVWTNVNTPGVNTGSGVEVYLIKSTDEGLTWSTPLKVNSDPLGTGKQHYLPWIACDPDNGNIAIVFYDNRNVSSTQTETWCAVSTDGAATFTDFAVSDVAATPSPISGLADGYMGDYLSIAAKGSMVYPFWADTRSGHPMTYVSPFLLTPAMNQAFIAYQDHQLNDITTGNHNGTPDYGEDLLLSLLVKNIGDKPDTNVMVTLSSDSPFVTFMDSTEFYGNFTIGEEKTITDGFAFHISDSVPNGFELVFNVKAVNNLDSVNYSYFSINAYAPHLSIGAIKVMDLLGNNNHVLDPGETADIVIHYTNNSLFDATNPISYLSCPQTFINIANPVVNLPSIGPGYSDSAVFHVTVSNIPFGSAAQFHNHIDYSYQTSQKSFNESIGLIVEDWETGTFTKFPWSFGGNANWTLDNLTKFEGEYSGRSATISHGQSSTLIIEYDVMYDDSITFYRKISSELFHDVLGFYVDATRIAQYSGTQNWKRVAYPVTAGHHTFKWEYLKDASNSIGEDAAWVDFIVFPPEKRTLSFAGNNMGICENQVALLNATAANYLAVLWTTDGTGSFSDNTILNPVYTPSQADIASGSVTLTLTVTGLSAGESSVSSMILTISPNPTAFAGADLTICQGTVHNLTNASATNYNSLHWTSSGDGLFNDPNALFPSYTPGNNDIANGMVALVIVADPANACQMASDTILITIHPSPVASLSANATVCKGDSTLLNYSITGTPPFVVTFDNGDVRNVPASTWQEWVKPVVNSIYAVTSVVDAQGCTGNGSTSASILVLPSPVLNLTVDTTLCANLVLNLSANAQGTASYLWSPGGQTTPTITIDTTGIGIGNRVFTLTATGSNNCKTIASSTVNFKDCTGIEEWVGNVSFTVYPNPNDGRFSIDFASRNKETIHMRVIDEKGGLVYQQNDIPVNGSTTKLFSLKNISQGSYLLILENNRSQVIRKLLIVK
jgi:hypothetical protein